MSGGPDGTTEYDRLRRRVMWAMPGGLYLLGSRCGEERNLMTLSWVTQVSSEPKCLGVGVETEAVTHRLVDEGGAFALSIVARDDRSVVRRFVKPATWDPVDEVLNGYRVREFATGAPVLAAAVAYLDCRVVERVRLGSHTLFIGEVAAAGFLREEDTPVLRMEDTRMSYGG